MAFSAYSDVDNEKNSNILAMYLLSYVTDTTAVKLIDSI